MDGMGAGSKSDVRKRCRRGLQIAALVPSLLGVGTFSVYAQVSKPYVEEALAQPSRDIPSREYQLQEFLLRRIPPLPSFTTPASWSAEEDRVRKHILDDVVYYGWA